MFTGQEHTWHELTRPIMARRRKYSSFHDWSMSCNKKLQTKELKLVGCGICDMIDLSLNLTSPQKIPPIEVDWKNLVILPQLHLATLLSPRSQHRSTPRLELKIHHGPKVEVSMQEMPTPVSANSFRSPFDKVRMKAMEPAKAQAPATPKDAPGGAPINKIRPRPARCMSSPKSRHKTVVAPTFKANILSRLSTRWSKKLPV